MSSFNLFLNISTGTGSDEPGEGPILAGTDLLPFICQATNNYPYQISFLSIMIPKF